LINFSTLCLFFCLAITAAARAGERQPLGNRAVKTVAELNLQPLRALSGSTNLDLAIVLPLGNQDGLADLLQQQYSPSSPWYHQWLTPDEFAAAFGPTEQDYGAVIEFATSNGLTVTGRHPNRTILDVRGSVADIERTFRVKLLAYQHPAEAREFFAPDVEPTVDLSVPILHVAGLDNYVVPRPLSVKGDPQKVKSTTPRSSGSGPKGSYMGYDFRYAYVPWTPLSGAGQVLGLVEFDGYYPKDITKYESKAKLPNVFLANVLVDGFDGTPTANKLRVTEVTLDIEMAISMAPGLSAVAVYEAPDNGVSLEDVLNRIATDDVAGQISSSWFFSGEDTALDQIYQQYAAQGQSYFQASGDNGAYTDSWPSPQQQADSTNITVVGGTMLKTSGGKGHWVSETVWNWNQGTGPGATNDASGGGISATYTIPSWQQGIDMTSNGGSTAMRNVPDVAMVASSIYVISNDGTASPDIGGTSCAAPLWAGFTALVNQQAVANGQPTVGFINPAIYAIGTGPTYAACFHDIIQGNNETYYSPSQFRATTGYDLCTGWGSPNGSNLVNSVAPMSEGISCGCPVIVSGPSGVLPAKGGSRTLKVKPKYTPCDWTAVSNDGFITITGGAHGMGNGTVRYTMSENTNAFPLTGTISIGDQVVTTRQAVGDARSP
jgi:subtilase family serine protease